jgi:hypothetical protein
MNAILQGPVPDSALAVKHAPSESYVTYECYVRRGDIYVLKDWTVGTPVPWDVIVAFAAPLYKEMGYVYGMDQNGVCITWLLDDLRRTCEWAEEGLKVTTDLPSEP